MSDGIAIIYVCFVLLIGSSHQAPKSHVRHDVTPGGIVDTSNISNFKISTPQPCEGDTFCEEAPGYPIKYIREMLKNMTLPFMRRPQKPSFYPIQNDYGFIENREPHRHRVLLTKRRHDGSMGEMHICKSFHSTHKPKAAQTVQGDWLYVINQDKLIQEVSVEYCDNPGSECQFVHLPFGYKSECQQNYNARRLYALSQNYQNVFLMEFIFPCHCSCKIVPTMEI